MPKTCPARISRNVNNARRGERCGKPVHADGFCFHHHPDTRKARGEGARRRAEARHKRLARIHFAERLVLESAGVLAAVLFVDGIVREKTLATMSPDVQECVRKVAEAAFALDEAKR